MAMAEFADASPHGLELVLFLRICRVEVRGAGFLAAMHSVHGPGSCFHRSGCAEHTLYIQRKVMTSSVSMI